MIASSARCPVYCKSVFEMMLIATNENGTERLGIMAQR